MRITIKVKPKSGRSEIIKKGESYLAYLKSEPDKGKANQELIKLATKFFKKKVRIVFGSRSKTKIIELSS